MTKITTPKSTYTFDYPWAIEMANTQLGIFWTADEIKVEKDVQDILVEMTDSERHGVITVLKLFTLYELIVGNEYWGGKIAKWFPRPDIQRMANCFSFFELNVHAPFYAKINEALNLATDEFYESYVNDPILKERMEFIESILDSDDMLESLGAFAMIEGAVLYSSFAFLKSFQSEGKNRLNNIVAGINFSVRDEQLHHDAGCALFKTLKEESGMADADIFPQLERIAHQIRDHEHRICDMIFERGEIDGITDVQLKHFIDSRVNLCLRNLGHKNIFNVKYNPISDWFYQGINSYVFHDFFAKVGREYNRNWSESEFVWGQVE